MVPIVILVGFVGAAAGRAVQTVALATVAWPALLLVAGVGSGGGFIVGAALLGAANALVGAALGRGARTLLRPRRHRLEPLG